MVADELKKDSTLGVPEDELNELMVAIAGKFKKEKRGAEADTESAESEGGDASTVEGLGKTAQLVFFPQPYARKVAELLADLREDKRHAYLRLIGRNVPNKDKKYLKSLDAEIGEFAKRAADASMSLTIDIGLFGRMTTSDLVVNVEAACQVAHAISTHETLVESDYFTAMDDLKEKYASTQSEKAGAAFLGSERPRLSSTRPSTTRYLNLDIDALKKHLPTLSAKEAARAAGVLVRAAALATPSGKQNSFAAHAVPELILVEASKAKRPLSYANAFLQPVEGGPGAT